MRSSAPKQKWCLEYDEWSCRDLSPKVYVYTWADGVIRTCDWKMRGTSVNACLNS